MGYTVRIHQTAEKDLERIPERYRRLLMRAILSLEDNPGPDPPRCKKIGDGFYRLRSGDFRIIYTIKGKKLLVLIVMVGNRKAIYKRFKRGPRGR